MKIPKTIKIGGFDWKVEISEDVANESNVFGSTHYKQQKIFLDSNVSKQKQEQTLIHEIMHAIWWQTGLWERFRAEETKKYEEEIIHALSFGFHQVFKDNKIYEKLKNKN